MNGSTGNRSSSRQWLRNAGLAAAGLFAFAAAAILSSSVTGADDVEGAVIAPVERVGTRLKDSTPPVSGQRTAAGAAAATPQTLERLNERVSHNPFAMLNLKTEASAVQAPPPPGPASKVKKPSRAPEPPAPLPPPPPAAPPLPFTAVGSIAGAQVTGGQPVAFVRQQDKLLVIRAGDAIGQAYRVDSITAQKIEFIYLPLMQRQSLALAT